MDEEVYGDEPRLWGLTVIATIFRWFEELANTIAGPFLQIGLGLALLDLLTDGALTTTQPWALWTWASSQVVGIDVQITGTFAKLRRAWAQHRYWRALGLLALGVVLCFVGYIAALTFSMEKSLNVSTPQALARIGFPQITWLQIRAALSVSLVALSALTRYINRKRKNVNLAAQDEKTKLQHELELEPLRQALRAKKAVGAAQLARAVTANVFTKRGDAPDATATPVVTARPTQHAPEPRGGEGYGQPGPVTRHKQQHDSHGDYLPSTDEGAPVYEDEDAELERLLAEEQAGAWETVHANRNGKLDRDRSREHRAERRGDTGFYQMIAPTAVLEGAFPPHLAPATSEEDTDTDTDTDTEDTDTDTDTDTEDTVDRDNEDEYRNGVKRPGTPRQVAAREAATVARALKADPVAAGSGEPRRALTKLAPAGGRSTRTKRDPWTTGLSRQQITEILQRKVATGLTLLREGHPLTVKSLRRAIAERIYADYHDRTGCTMEVAYDAINHYKAERQAELDAFTQEHSGESLPSLAALPGIADEVGGLPGDREGFGTQAFADAVLQEEMDRQRRARAAR